FAVAPNISTVAVLTVCKDDAVGGIAMAAPLCLVAFQRKLFDRYDWTRLDPLKTVEAATPCMLNRRGSAGELAPLDLTDEPDVARVLRSFARMLEVDIDPRVKMPTSG